MNNIPLSDREIEILRLVAQGKSNKDIANALFISVNTVKVHLSNIFQKTNVVSRTEATLYAIEHGIVDSPGSKEPVKDLISAPVEAVKNNQTSWQIFWNKYWWGMIAVGFLIIFGISFLLADTPLFAASTPPPNPLLTVLLQNEWQDCAPMPNPRASMAVAVYDDAIFAIAGELSSGPTGLVERYDIEADEWGRQVDKPTAVSNVSAVLIGEKIYVPGGVLANGNMTNILEVYDPRKDSWETKASLPRAVSAYALAISEGQMYLFGGWDGQKVLDLVFRYNPADDVWYEASRMPTARAYSSAIETSEGIYVIGGWDGEKVLNIIERYTPSRESENEIAWDKVAQSPVPLTKVGVVTIGDVIFSFTGDAIWEYSPRDGNWTELEKAQDFEIRENSGNATSQGYYYIFGGKDNKGNLINRNSKYRVLYQFFIPVLKK